MALQALRAIARALSDPRSPSEVADILVSHVGERFQPSATVVYLVDPGGQARLLASRGLDEAARERLACLRPSEELPLMVAMKTGEAVWYETKGALLADFPHLAQSTTADLEAVFAIPFRVDHRVVGGLAISFDAARALDTLEREVLATIGDLAAQAIERFRLEQRFRRMHDATPDGVSIITPVRDASGGITDFRYVYVNPTVARAMGRSPGDLLGRTFLEVLPGLDKTPFWDAFCRVATSGTPETYEQPYGENGWSGWYRNTVVSLGDELAVVYTDITPRKRAEDALRFLAEASTILGNSLDYETTLRSVAKLAVPTIADWATVDMLGSDERLHRLAIEHADPSKVSLARALAERFPIDLDAPHGVGEVLRTGKPELLSEISDALLEASVPDPERRALIRSLGLRSAIRVPLRARGRVIGALSVFAAETGRRYTQDDLRLLEDLAQRAGLAIDNALLYRAAEDASNAKDDFLAVVSHELRTPLNAILGWTHLLKESSLSLDRRARALETIERNARSQNQLIDDLLDLSRIVSGNLRLDVGQVDLPLVVERAVETVRPAALAKGVDIRFDFDPSTGPVLGDPDRLQQVVWNLLSNAVKFSTRGGIVQVALERGPASLEIAVHDLGEGIDPDFLPHVFERFRQADGSRTRAKGGLGLGLAIVRKLVELHGGSIRAESEGRGKGATFTVSLPASSARPPSFARPPAIHLTAAAPSALCPPEVQGLHVLVVDDEADARDLLAELLTSCRSKVSTAASVEEAMRLVGELRPDVVISDIGMPHEDGYALIRRLRSLSSEEGGNTPAIALTAYTRTEERTKALVAGFNTHVAKPVEPAELLAVLRSLA